MHVTIQEAFPIMNILAPQSPHLPRVAGRPFFIVTCSASCISRLSLHFRQYPGRVEDRRVVHFTGYFSNPSSPNRTCTFQCIRLSSRILCMALLVAALCTLCKPPFLSRFPTCPPSPCSGLSPPPFFEYYEDSVTTGLSILRQSRVPSRVSCNSLT